MPRVPRLDGTEVREEIQPLTQNKLRPDAETFGGGAASAGAFGAIQGFAKDAQEIYGRVIDTETKNADSDMSVLQSQVEASVQTFRGKNALESEAVAEKQWTEGVAKISEKYQNKDVQARVQGLARHRQNNLLSKAARHSMTELEKYEDESQASYMQNQRNDAVENYADPGAIQDSITKQELALESYARNKGWSPQQKKLALEESVSKTHLGVLNGMIKGGDDLMATAYFKKNKDGFNGDDLTTANGLVESSDLRAKSQAASDKIMLTIPDPVEAVAKAREIKDPTLRDETVRRVKDRLSEKKEIQRMSREKLHTEASNFLDDTPDIDAYQKEHGVEWDRFTTSEKSSLRSYAYNRKLKGQPVTNWEKWYGYETMVSVPELRDKFLKTNLYKEARPHLDDAKFSELTKLQRDMRLGKGDANKSLDGFRSKNQIVNDGMKAAGLNPNPNPGSSDAEETAKFRKRIDDDIRQFQQDSGKKATNEQVQSITDKNLKEIVTDRGFIFNSTKRAFEVQTDDIPVGERNEIERQLREAGYPVTDANVVDWYLDLKSGE